MLINCKACNLKNKVFEIVELKDSNYFENRLVFKATCSKCGEKYGMFLEIRKDDKMSFFSKLNEFELIELIKKEKRNIVKYDKYDGYSSGSWRYGINKEIKNRNGKTIKIRQYGADYKSGIRSLEKEIVTI